MTAIFAENTRLPEGWVSNVRLAISGDRIAAIEIDAVAETDDHVVHTLLPALGNLHSHSFQRAMAGMTEVRADGRDSFWTWRELMYRFLDKLTPEAIEAIAAQVFLEMLEAGYSSVGEFHYVHHQPGGAPYDTLSETGQRILAAAAETGIGLTLLPVLYSHGGAGGKDLTSGQARFGNQPDRFGRLVEELRHTARAGSTDTVVGIAPHSLRATTPGTLAAAVAAHGEGPIHIHIAEQTAEVADVEAWLGARPVAWLLDTLPVDDRWCLVHATHMTALETRAMAESRAVAGLCPITEANLGDGIFDGVDYLAHGGAFGIGSDSNIRIALGEELRTLEYGQRLRDRSRNRMRTGAGSVGANLYLSSARGGAAALGRDAGEIAVGRLADLVAINGSDAALCALAGDSVLDGLVFAAPETVVRDVWSAGRHVIRDGQHPKRSAITARYAATLKQLLEAA